MRIDTRRPQLPHPEIPTSIGTVADALRSERLRCARDVHDIVLQDLTAVLLQLRAASGCADPARLAACLDIARQAAEQGIASARDFVQRLRTGGAEASATADLVPAIRAALAAMPLARGVTLKLDMAAAAVLDTVACEHAAMIVREAVGNAAKHASAGTVVCRLRVRAGRVRVQVRDDGPGFDTHAARPGFGIGGMHERAALIGAALHVDSAPGRGTTISLSLPLATGE
ncbi:histidine kinase/DNA gyrase B/HSP90-like ATPase [Pseudoduganella flava]|nr:sensor histidine kinase [Pseudoduganella flava]TWI40979.1 histidine kinase/DNA gyrase B/HSP90-like ATPase [Pseudoduganella flava]